MLSIGVCKICKEETKVFQPYDEAPGSWVTGVCKKCASEEYKKHSARIRLERAGGYRDSRLITCYTCLDEKPAMEFRASDTASYEIGFWAHCRDCQNARDRARYAKKKIQDDLSDLI